MCIRDRSEAVHVNWTLPEGAIHSASASSFVIVGRRLATVVQDEAKSNTTPAVTRAILISLPFMESLLSSLHAGHNT